MIVVRLTKTNGPFVIRSAVRILKRGGVIAFPTETTYGLGCDPRNAKAARQVFSIKGRKKKKPLLLVASDLAQVRRVVDVSFIPKRLLKYWPGPLTLVLPVKKAARLQKLVAPKGDVAIRVSSSKFVQRLTSAFNFPIIATSANKSGEPDCRSGRAVKRTFRDAKNTPDLILDAGSLPRRRPSTVARVEVDGNVRILRQGGIRI